MHWDLDLIADIMFYIAGTILIIGMIPFHRKIYKNKCATDLTWLYLISQVVVNAVMVTYGAIRLLFPMIYTNGVLLLMFMVLVGQKIYYDYFYKSALNYEGVDLPTQLENLKYLDLDASDIPTKLQVLTSLQRVLPKTKYETI